MPDYRYETEPTCPHCGREIRDPVELFSDMEETTETECGSCEKPFTITRIVTFYYSAQAGEGGEV